MVKKVYNQVTKTFTFNNADFYQQATSCLNFLLLNNLLGLSLNDSSAEGGFV